MFLGSAAWLRAGDEAVVVGPDVGQLKINMLTTPGRAAACGSVRQRAAACFRTFGLYGVDEASLHQSGTT
jgi:hypothetical protein